MHTSGLWFWCKFFLIYLISNKSLQNEISSFIYRKFYSQWWINIACCAILHSDRKPVENFSQTVFFKFSLVVEAWLLPLQNSPLVLVVWFGKVSVHFQCLRKKQAITCLRHEAIRIYLKESLSAGEFFLARGLNLGQHFYGAAALLVEEASKGQIYLQPDAQILLQIKGKAK